MTNFCQTRNFFNLFINHLEIKGFERKFTGFSAKLDNLSLKPKLVTKLHFRGSDMCVRQMKQAFVIQR